MSTPSLSIPPGDQDDPILRESDTAAVLEHLASGKPLDPAVVARVRARAGQVTSAIRRNQGIIDDATFQTLLDDEA